MGFGQLGINEYASLITAFSTLIGLVFIFLQVRIGVKSFRHDHDRRRKKATFDMYAVHRERIRDLDNEIRDVFSIYQDKLTLSKADLDFLYSEDGKETRRLIRELLSLLERLSVGARHDIYDMAIFDELSGTVFMKLYNRYEPYIQKARQTSPTYFTAFEWLVHQIRKRRKIT